VRSLVAALMVFSISCSNEPRVSSKHEPEPDTTIYTAYSTEPHSYARFNSQSAINEIAIMENHYFQTYKTGITPYYGTKWRESAEYNYTDFEDYSATNQFKSYLDKLGSKPDSMHCTLYAVKALKSGLDSLWPDVERIHNQLYKEHEHAGWSMAHVLVKHFGWQAHLFIKESSTEYEQCVNHFKKHQTYPVWKQPDIKLENLFVIGKQDSLITELLSNHEFGWGFSFQGWHTWITRHNSLKECIWHGAPGLEYEIVNLPLFRSTPFLDYHDYDSHVIVFPPKIQFVTEL